MRNNPYSLLSLIPKYFNDYKTAYNFCISCKLGYILGYKQFKLEYDKLRLEYAKKLGWKKCVKKGYIDLIKILCDNKLINRYDYNIFSYVCSNGNLDILKYLNNNNAIYPYIASPCAINYDRLNIIKWYFENCNKEDVYLLYTGITDGMYPFEFIKRSDEQNCFNYLYNKLLKIEHILSNKEYLINSFNKFKLFVFAYACAKNQFNFIKYFAEENINFKMIGIAIQYGSNLDIIKWIYENTKENYENNQNIYYINDNINLEIIKWIYEKKIYGYITIYNNEMDIASNNGNLEIVKWLHNYHKEYNRISPDRTEGCTTSAMNNASANGHLDVVKWLHENRTEGCTTSAMDNASVNGHLDVVKWLHENRTEGCTTNAMDNAIRNGHLKVVKWLHENRTEGCTTNAMDNASANGHLEVVKWLHENRKEGCTKKAMNWASMNGHLEIVKFLHENRTEGCTKYAMDYASRYGHLEIVKWLHNYYKGGNGISPGCTTHAMDSASNRGHHDEI